MKMAKRFLALLLALTMVLSNLPVSVLAEEFSELTAEAAAEISEETAEVTTEAAGETTEEPTEEPAAAPEAEEPEETTAAQETSSPETTTVVESEEPSEEPGETGAPEETEAPMELITEDAAMAGESEPYLTYLQLSDRGNGWAYQDGGHLNGYYIQPGNEFYHIYFLNDGSGTPTPVNVTSNHDDLVLAQDLPVAEGETYGDYFYRVRVNDWELENAQVQYIVDGEVVAAMDVDTSLPEASFHYEMPCDKNTYISGMVPLAYDEENVIYFRYASDYWTLDSISLPDEFDGVAWYEGTEEPGVYAITLGREFLNGRGSRHLCVDYSLSNAEDEATSSSNLSVYCYYAPYLSFGWLDDNDGVLTEAAGHDDRGFQIMPGQNRTMIFYLNVWNEESQGYVANPVHVQSGDTSRIVLESVSGQAAEGQEHAEYFYRVIGIGWGESDEPATIVYNEDTRAELYVDVELYGLSFHSDITCTEENHITSLEVSRLKEENVFYIRYADDFWAMEDLEIVPEHQQYATMEHVTEIGFGYDCYKVTLNPSVVDELTRNPDWEIGFQYQSVEIGNPDNAQPRRESLKLYSHDPYLSFGWLNNNGEGFYEDGEANGRDYDIRLGYEVFHIYYLNQWNEAQGKYVPSPVNVTYEENGVITMESVAVVRGDQDNGGYFYHIVSTGWGDTTISYQIDETVTVSMDVHCNMGSISSHSDSSCTEENYITGMEVSRYSDNTFYLRFEDPDWEIAWGEDYYGIDITEGSAHWEICEQGDNYTVFEVTVDSGYVEEVARDSNPRGLKFRFDLWERENHDNRNSQELFLDLFCYDPILVFRGLENWGDGYFVRDEDGNMGIRIRPGEEHTVIFYLRSWNGEQYEEEPVSVFSSDTRYLRVQNIPEEEIAEGQWNGEYFCKITVTGDAWYQDAAVCVDLGEDNVVSMPVDVCLEEESFHSGYPCDTSNFVTQWVVDPFAEEGVIYLRYVDDHVMLLEDVEFPDSVKDMVEAEIVEQGIFKITMTKDLVALVADGGFQLDYTLKLQCQQDQDHRESRERSIGCVAETETSPLAILTINGDTYEYFGPEKFLHHYPTGGYHENGDRIWAAKPATALPEGVSYDPDTNTLTLTDAELTHLNLGFSQYEGMNGNWYTTLPSENLTIKLEGESTLINDSGVALGFYGGLNVTFTGKGSLYVKAINNVNNRDRWGDAYHFAALEMEGGTLTLRDSVNITVEQSGSGLETVWEDEGYHYERPAHLNAMNLWNDADLVLEDSASLTTVVPEGAMDSGTEQDEYGEFPGGYGGISDARTVTVKDNATLNTTKLRVYGGYTQSGGTVTITGLKNKFINEEGNEQYHYDGLDAADGAYIDISGGTLTVNINSRETEDLYSNFYFYGVVVRGGRLDISGGTVTVNGICGNAFQIEPLYNEYGYPVQFAQVSISGGTINASGWGNEVTREIWSVSFMDLNPGCQASFTGGTLNTEWSNLMLGGNVVFSGATLNGYGTVLTVDSEFKMQSGTITLDSGAWINNGMTTMIGGKLNLPGTWMEVNSGFSFQNGTIDIDYHGQNPNDLEQRPDALTINGYFQVGDTEADNAVLTIKNKTTSHSIFLGQNWDENGEYLGSGTLYISKGGTVDVDSTISDDIRGDDSYISVLGDRESGLMVHGGTLNVDAENIDCAVDICGGYWQSEGTVNIRAYGAKGQRLAMAVKDTFDIYGGTLNVTGVHGMDLGDYVEYQTEGSGFYIEGGALNVKAEVVGINLCTDMTITGGDVNMNLSGSTTGDWLEAFGIFVSHGDEGTDEETGESVHTEASLTILGGNITIELCGERAGYNNHLFCIYGSRQNVSIEGVTVENGNIVSVEGGSLRFIGGTGLYIESMDPEKGLKLAEDMVVYSMDGGRELALLDYGTVTDVFDRTWYISGFEEDNVAGNIQTGEGVEFAYNTVVTSNKSGETTNWEIVDGTLKIQGSGNITDFNTRYQAPWAVMSNFITAVEIGADVTYVGDYAFAGLENVEKVTFLGKAPVLKENAFAGLKASVSYPVEDESWANVAFKDYGGEMDWVIVGVARINSTADYLFATGKATLTVELSEDKDLTINWSLEEESKDYATLSVKNNVATVTAKTVLEKQSITVYANVKDSKAAPASITLPIYPKAQSVSIFSGGKDVTNGTISFNYENTDPNAPEVVVNLSATLNPLDPSEDGFLGSVVQWSSGNAKIATVDENGVVSFLKFGDVKIIATALDGSKKTASVTLSPYYRYQGSFTAVFDPDTTNGLQVGEEAQMIVTDEAGKVIPAEELEFKVVSGGKFATVNEYGVVTANAASGSVTVQATFTEDNVKTKRSVRAALKTIPVAPEAIELDYVEDDSCELDGGYIKKDGFANAENGDLELYVNAGKKKTFKLTAMGLHPNGTDDLSVVGQLKWSTSNSKIATVKDSKGNITITTTGTEGDCVIEAVSTLNPEVKAKVTISVKNLIPKTDKTSITLDTMKANSQVVTVTAHQDNPVTDAALLIYDAEEKNYVETNDVFEGEYDADTGEITITSVDVADKGTVKAQLKLTTQHGEPTIASLSIKVSNSAVPKYTVKQTRKLNATEDLTGLITVTSTAAEIESVELEDCDYEIVGTTDDGAYEVALKPDVGYADDLNGVLRVEMEGYRPARYSIKLADANTKTYSLSLNTNIIAAEASAAVAFGEDAVVDNIYILDTDTKTEETDDDFLASYADGKITVTYLGEEPMTGSVKAQVRMTDGRTANLTIKAANKAPTITVKMVKKINTLDDPDYSYGLISVTAKEGEVTSVILDDAVTYALGDQDDDGNYIVTPNWEEGEKTVAKGNVTVEVDGYLGTYTKSATIGTEKVKDKAVLGETTLTLYRNLPDMDLTTTLNSYFAGTEITEAEFTGPDMFEVTYDGNGNVNVVLTGDLPTKNSTYSYTTVPVTDAETTLAKVTLKVKIADAPTVKLKTTKATLKLSKPDTVVEIPVTAPEFADYGPVSFEDYDDDKVQVTYDADAGILTVSLKEGCETTGKETIELIPYYSNVALKPLNLTVTVSK